MDARRAVSIPQPGLRPAQRGDNVCWSGRIQK